MCVFCVLFVPMPSRSPDAPLPIRQAAKDGREEAPQESHSHLGFTPGGIPDLRVVHHLAKPGVSKGTRIEHRAQGTNSSGMFVTGFHLPVDR